MIELPEHLEIDDVAAIVEKFDHTYGRTSLYLAAHAAVAHRLRPELVALIRTNFLPSPHRFQAAHDADVLFGPLCKFQGGGFFEMQRQVKDFLVGVLDKVFPPSLSDRFRSQDVAHLLRHHLRRADPESASPGYEQFRQENLWRAITIDDALAARDHLRAHAVARSEMARDDLPKAPRGAGIISVAGPMLGLFQSEIAYLEVQDLIADGENDRAVALLELMVETGAEIVAEPRLAPARLLSDEMMFMSRRRNMAGEAGLRTGEAGKPPSAALSTVANDLEVDPQRLRLQNTALTRAAMAGDRSALELALAEPDLEINQLDRYGLAALHHAVRGGHPDMALRLLDAGADINVTSAYDVHPLFFTGEHGLTELARIFLARGATLLQPSAKKSTPLMSACWSGHRDLVALYLEQPAADESYLNARNDDLVTALYCALNTGDAKLYDMLVAAGARPGQPATSGWTQLHGAAAGKSVGLVERVLRSGYTVDPLTQEGWSPLHVACSNTPSLAVVQLLLDCGADPWRETIHGWTPTRISASWDNLDILRHLLALGAPLTPQLVHDAAGGGACAVLDYLLNDRAVPVHARTLVDLMIGSGKPAAAEYMLDRLNLFGTTPGDIFLKAVRSGAHQIVALFHKWGWPFEVSEGQDTALPKPLVDAIGQIKQNWKDTATVLLAWPQARTMVGELIFLKAVERGEADILRLFQSNGWQVPGPPPRDAAPNQSGKTTEVDWLEALKKAHSGLRDTLEVLLGWTAFRDVAAAELFEAALARGHLDVFDLFSRRGWSIPDKPRKDPGWAWVVGSDLRQRDELILSLIGRPGAIINPGTGERLIYLAAEGGLLGTLGELIRHGEPLEATDRLNETPLSAAMLKARWESVRVLVEAGADPNTLTGPQHEPVFFRAGPANVPLLPGADLTRRALNGRSILHVIAPLLIEPAAEALLTAALDAGLDIDAPDAAGWTALHVVAERNSPGAVKSLVAAGASLEARTAAGLTPLLLALSRGQTATADALLAAGAEPAGRTPGGVSLLHIAAEQDMADLLRKYWLELGGPGAISLNPPRTVLQTAVEADARKAVEVLLELKTDPDRAAGSSLPPLLLAIRAGRYQLAMRLLDAGALPAARDPAVGHDALSDLNAQRQLLTASRTAIPEPFNRLYNRLSSPGVPQPDPGQPASPSRPASIFRRDPAAAETPKRADGLQPLEPGPAVAVPISTSAAFLADLSEPAWQGWNPVSGGRIGRYKKELDALGAGYGAAPVSEYASRPLSFYPGAQLVRFRSNAWAGKPRAIFLLALPGRTLWLDGAAPPIHQANALVAPRLTYNNTLEYLRFFCFFVRGDNGPFYVLEDPNDANVAELRKTHASLIDSVARPASVQTGEAGAFSATATVLYADACFQAEFQIGQDGKVVMRNSTPFADKLPVRLDLPIR